MADFIVNDIAYRSGKLDAMTQGLIAKRFAPAILSLGAAASMKRPAEEGEKPSQPDLDSLVAPVADAISKMSDDDFIYVVSKCMAVTLRQRPGDTGYAPVWNETAKKPMFDDINVFAMITIVGQVLIDQLGDFGSVPSLNFSR